MQRSSGCASLDPGLFLAKMDIELAFRLLPVHLSSFQLSGCCWEGQFYVDRCLTMGFSISCAYFETFSIFLKWVVKQEAQIQSTIFVCWPLRVFGVLCITLHDGEGSG